MSATGSVVAAAVQAAFNLLSKPGWQYTGLLFGTLGVMGTWSGRRDWVPASCPGSHVLLMQHDVARSCPTTLGFGLDCSVMLLCRCPI